MGKVFIGMQRKRSVWAQTWDRGSMREGTGR